MIYVSTSCIKAKYISDSIELLIRHDFKNIELSGGTIYYDRIGDDLLRLKDKYKLNYTIHNYFPPPKENFVLNLASLNNDIYQKSIDHAISAIDFAKKLNINKIGFHAGFFADLKPSDLGRNLQTAELINLEASLSKFFNAMRIIQGYTKQIEVYFENNVITQKNLELYDYNDPFMLTKAEDYIDLYAARPFNLLLDVAHLKVSAQTHGINFKAELEKLLKHTNYLHISDNDSLADQNRPILESSELFKILSQQNLKGKIITLEVYDTISSIKHTYNLISNLISI